MGGPGSGADNPQKWSSGKSGNPKGRPKKGQSLTERLYNYGEDKYIDGDANNRTYNQEFIHQWWKDMLLPGEKILKKDYLDRVCGKAQESLNITNNDSDEINIEDLPDDLKREYHVFALKELNEKEKK